MTGQMSPQYLLKFVEELKKRAVPAHDIESFERHCASLSNGAVTPCPFCYVVNKRGVLAQRTEVAGLVVLQCENCDISVVVRAP